MRRTTIAVLASLAILSITLGNTCFVRCFLIPRHSRQHPAPSRRRAQQHRKSPFTALWTAKTIICQGNNGTESQYTLKDSASLRQLFEEYRLFRLFDYSNEKLIGANDFDDIADGHVYCMLRLSQAPRITRVIDNSHVNSGLGAEEAMNDSSKTISYIDAHGNARRRILEDQDGMDILLRQFKATCLADDKGNEIVQFKTLQNGATYSLVWFATDQAGAATSSKRKIAFDYSTLPKPEDVVLPPIDGPEFVSEPGWVERATESLIHEFDSSDATGLRVRPMALVGYSGSGKTRAMQELAKHVKARLNTRPVGVIFITFNDYSPCTQLDKADPGQGLCRRLMFAAQQTTAAAGDDLYEAYQEFLAKDYFFDFDKVTQWLKKSHVIVFVDELSNVLCGHEHIGNFIRYNFIVQAGSYFVFSAQVLSTIGLLAGVVEGFRPKDRRVIHQNLPLVGNLTEAQAKLDSNLKSANVAIFYALSPATIYTQRLQPGIRYQQQEAVREFNAWDDATKMKSLRRLFKSIFTGNINEIPQPLHTLLGTKMGESRALAMWPPFALEHLLTDLQVPDDSITNITTVLAGLLSEFKSGPDEPGVGWQALFYFQLIARCLANWHDAAHEYALVPRQWFAHFNVKIEYNSGPSLIGDISRTHDWSSLLEQVEIAEAPTIFIFRPTGMNFPDFDLIVIYWRGGEILDFYGYRLRKGRTYPKVNKSTNQTAPTAEILQKLPEVNVKCFWVREIPPKVTRNSHGWIIPCGDVIDTFYGASGWYWTPQLWRKLQETAGTDAPASQLPIIA
ncbi:hypothetical protein MPSEU_001079700 [Mayamaea pseudoterrestris]|nr:hypothetical protein MPSEU_001079700 [Mayamaea pseudoterrestris]